MSHSIRPKNSNRQRWPYTHCGVRYAVRQWCYRRGARLPSRWDEDNERGPRTSDVIERYHLQRWPSSACGHCHSSSGRTGQQIRVRRLSLFYEAEACAVREQFWAITTTPTTIKLNDTRYHVNTVSEMSMQVRSAKGPGIARSWCV